MEQNIFKGITVMACPHCSEDLYIEVQSTTPVIQDILTDKDVREAKDAVIHELSGSLSEEALKKAVDTINDESFLFGQSDIQNVIDQYST